MGQAVAHHENRSFMRCSSNSGFRAMILSAMGLPTCAPKLWPARPPPSQSGGEGGDWLN
jgi:hypothetical protein